MVFSDIKLACYEATGYGSSPPTEVATRFSSWINEGYRHIMRLPGITEIRRLTFEFASVADQDPYALPQLVERVDAIVDQTNQYRLGYLTNSDYRSIDPGQITTGPPTKWRNMGTWPVFIQPSSTGVWIVSSQGADVTQVVTIQGIDSTGVLRSPVTATLNGTTRVAVGSITDYVYIQVFTMATVATGEVSLYNAAASGTVLGKILIGDKFAQHIIIGLWPTAGDAYTYVVDGQARLSPLSAASDIPIFTEISHDLLVTYGRMREYERTGRTTEWKMCQGEWVHGTGKLAAQVQFPPDYRVVPCPQPATSPMGGWNGLTGWFPSDY